MKQSPQQVTVLGDGAFGTAFATLLAHNGHQVTLWCYNQSVADDIRKNQVNSKYLPGIKLSENVIPITSLEKALANDIIFEAIPVPFMRCVLEQCKPYAHADHLWVILSKGIEQKTVLLPSQIVQTIFQDKISCSALSGPSYAHELAAQQPTGMTIAGQHETVTKISQLLSNNYLFLEPSEDLLGVQLVGALKNSVAVAIGLLEGAGYGTNTQVLCMMRMLEEIKQILNVYDCSEKTLYNFAGIGDLVLTCFGKQSRNYKFGFLMGQHTSYEAAIKMLGLAPEGVNTLSTLKDLAEKHTLEIPLFAQLHEIVFNQGDVEKFVQTIFLADAA